MFNKKTLTSEVRDQNLFFLLKVAAHKT